MDLEGSEAQDVAIDQLVLSPEYQLRERLELWKVEEYAAVFDRLPPVLVARLEVGLCLLDGMHRLAAAQLLGRTSVPAKIVETDANAAFVLAIRSNAAHGLPLKTKEKKAAARGMLARFPERSDRWVAEDVGLSHPTVMSLRGELEAGGKIYHLGYALGQDGKRYPCECSRCRPGRVGAARSIGFSPHRPRGKWPVPQTHRPCTGRARAKYKRRSRHPHGPRFPLGHSRR